MTILNVALGQRSYDILVEEGLLDRAADHLAGFARDGRLIVVSDETVWAAQGERLSRGLGPVQAAPIILPPGEASKSWATLAHLVDRLLALGVERRDHIVAFGGGVIGDLAGFAAAIVNRGCGFVQIPTSLLAQVDSSVGGKTAINVPAGKNLVGAFHQPSLVLIDPTVLATLDARQLRAGYAEIVKYALIEDAPLFAWLEENGPALLGGEPGLLHHAIAAAVAGKARIVAEDERETLGRRALLNLGHTFGHALEAETGYSDRLLHGEAVAAGIVCAFQFSVERRLCPSADAERVQAHLAATGLPTRLGDIGIAADGRRLVAHMMHDKKREGGRLPFILTRGIGQAFVDMSVELEEVEHFLDRRA
ncbi:3-dehydroquinate synthase [Sphingosinicella humi]|uniref:3-dehydroquinate synthase n=1 Tax=Allosphingosinicella humi TaxID=2068657 RepID=A0A2U2J4G6_9SPHN|nr:3-dehydroquinate synthase [Sphingosinicella humi]PWG03218.1 3-dehydroquinate synthase [Sphingosinicella humi]